MASEELVNTVVATVTMGIVVLAVLYLKTTNVFAFELFFEACLFYVPMGLLLLYLAVLKFRKPAATISAHG
jgi:uncharacterized membrane protein YhdT